MFDLILCISDAVDLISPFVADHHRRVAYLAFQIGRQYGLSLPRLKDLAIAAALHDIGALSLKERIDILNFEMDDSGQHAEIGYLLLSDLEPFQQAAEIVRYHHIPWNDGAGKSQFGQPVPIESHILNLADRISVIIDPKKEVLSQVRHIRQRLQQKSGRMFMPEVLDAFWALAEKDYVWFDLVAPSPDITVWRDLDWDVISLQGDEFLELVQFFCRIVDFKSPFTATHSSGVAACARWMSEAVGFSSFDQKMIYIAGYLHDIGKLCVPSEILEKAASLSSDETAVMRHHSYYTNHILQRVGILDTVRVWSAYHHERLDGSGYPYHLRDSDLSQGSRIVAVADVFTAIMENRPYRAGMQKVDGLRVMNDLAKTGKLDEKLVKLLNSRFDEIMTVISTAESSAALAYEQFAQRSAAYRQINAADS